MNAWRWRLRLALPLAVIALATSGAAWSPRLDLSLTSGAWSAPGGVSSGLLLWYDTAESGTMSLAPRLRYWFDKSGQGEHGLVMRVLALSVLASVASAAAISAGSVA